MGHRGHHDEVFACVSVLIFKAVKKKKEEEEDNYNNIYRNICIYK